MWGVHLRSAISSTQGVEVGYHITRHVRLTTGGWVFDTQSSVSVFALATLSPPRNL